MVATQQGYTPDFSDLNVSFNAARGESFGTDGRFGGDRMTGRSMYWRKPENDPRVKDEGYVVVGSATPQELVRQMDKGFMPLRQFGEFMLWNPSENWRVMNEPYRRIFQRPGGLMVFPTAQVIEHHWHLVPPYAGITFPQLAGIELTDIRCVECRQWYTSKELLAKHRSVAHRMTAQNSALGESIATAVSQLNAPLAGALKEQTAALTRIADRLALNQDETDRLRRMFEDRASYGGQAGVPRAPDPEPEEVGSDAEPIDSVMLDPNAVASPPNSGGRRRDPETGRLLPREG